MYGDLDESKLIEGLTGEKGIYRRRGDKEPEVCTFNYCFCCFYFDIIMFCGLKIYVVQCSCTANHQ